MAGMTGRRRSGGEDPRSPVERPGRRPSAPATPDPTAAPTAAADPVPRPPIDPRAVRVTASATGRVDGDPTMIVSPPSDPVLRPIERLAGTAILGGIPSPVDRSHDGHGAGLEPSLEPVTPASRLIEVDGSTIHVDLERLDDEHAILVEGVGSEARRTRVVLGPDPSSGNGWHRRPGAGGRGLAHRGGARARAPGKPS